MTTSARPVSRVFRGVIFVLAFVALWSRAAEPGLVAHWAFDEGSGSVAHDSSGNGHDGVIEGSYSWSGTGAPAVGGTGSLSFDPTATFTSGARVVVPDGGALSGLPQITVSCWLKADAWPDYDTLNAGTAIFYTGYNGDGSDHNDSYGVHAYLRGGKLLIWTQCSNGSQKPDLTIWVDDIMPGFDRTAWHHLALTHDGAAYRVYLDGVVAGTVALSGPLVASPSQPFCIGHGNGSAPGLYFDGLIDEVKVYDYARTPEQIAADVSPDTDSDTLPDAWELTYFGNLDETAAGDPDRDGRTNADEYADGTSPVDSGDTLGLVAYYPLDGDPADAGPDGYHGTVVGTVTPATDRFGQPGGAYDFQGSNDYITLPSFQFGGALTVSAWLYCDDVFDYNAGIFGCGNGTNNNVTQGITLGWRSTTGQTQFQIQGSGPIAVLDDGIFPEGQWVHLVAVHDGVGTGTLYLNGELAASGALNPSSVLSRTHQFIGSNNWPANNEEFDGRIDDVRLYNRALSHQEIACLAEADSDGDGLPDVWEVTYFGDLDETGEGDPDGDGATNVQEYANGTNPTVAEALPVIGFGGPMSSAAESAGTVSIPVTLSSGSSQAVSVDYAVTGGTATAGQDYTAAADTLVFAPGETTKTIAITINNDSIDEIDETIELTLSNPANAVMQVPLSAVVTIQDDDATGSAAWELTAPMPYGFYSTDAAMGLDGKIYIPGGSQNLAGNARISTALVFDEAATDGQQWSVLAAQLQTARGGVAVAADHAGRIYAISGADANAQWLTSVERYDPQTQMWGTAADLPLARWAARTATDSLGRIWVIGGMDSGWTPTRQVQVYDPETNTWSQGTETIYQHGEVCRVSIDAIDRVIAVDGYGCERFDPRTGEWESLGQPYLGGQPGEAIACPDGSIVAAGGWTGSTHRSDAKRYNPLNGQWEAFAGLNIARNSPAGIIARSGMLYVFGGDPTYTTVERVWPWPAVPVTLTTTAGSPTEIAAIPCTAEFGMPVFGFTVEDILLDAGATVAGFAGSDGDTTFTFNVIPAALGEISVRVLPGAAGDADGHSNSASNEIILNYQGALVGFATAFAAVAESGAALDVQCSLSKVSTQTITVDYATSDGTATAGSDYSAASGTLTFAPGEVSKTITITIADDGVAEMIETVEITLANPTNAVLDTAPTPTYPPTHRLDILDVTPRNYNIMLNTNA